MDEPAAVVVDAAGRRASSSADLTFIGLLSGELPRIQRIARLLTGDADSAEEIVAEAIARALPKWRAGGVQDGPAYLRRVVVNLAARRWRRRVLAGRRDHRALDWIATVDPPGALTDERDRVLRAVMRLPVRRRAVVALRFYDGLTEQQIADVLGINVGTVKSQLSRAVGQLRGDLGALEE